jgi:hypothetical protein
MRRATSRAIKTLLVGLLGLPGLVIRDQARADEPQVEHGVEHDADHEAGHEVTPARFAVVVGVNHAVDRDIPALRYADDDAAGYLEMFRALGARTYLVSRFDENTRRVHSQAAAEAQDPRRGELVAVLDQVARDVARARARNVPTVLYFVYAGHGRVEGGRGYLALEDSRLYGLDLERLVVDKVRAGQSHLIVDACYSVFLAFGRGPGGERREAHGFSSVGGLAARPDVGLLLSTSSARESHEWSEYQAGVFSHEVRSGLLGAADADGDALVSYREIAAFIDRANASVPNDRFRPDVYVKQPTAGPAIMDLRPGLGRRLELTGAHPGHYLVEDARGVRVADFHNAAGQAMHLIRPANTSQMFLRRVGDGVEYVMDTAPPVLRFEDLRVQSRGVVPRGAAHESFRLLFSLSFSQQVVDDFVLRAPAEPPDRPGPASAAPRPLAYGLVVAGGAAATGAAWAVLSARSIQRKSLASQADVLQANRDIDRRNGWARWLTGLGGAALVTGAALLLWPDFNDEVGAQDALPVTVGLTPNGGGLNVTGRF